MPSGGSRKGAGRKARAIEDNVREAIKQALGDDSSKMNRIWSKICEQAESGSSRHQEILFSYFYGRPKETVQVEGGLQINLVRKVITK